MDESSCEQSRKALADVLRYVTETLTQKTLRQHKLHQYEVTHSKYFVQNLELINGLVIDKIT